MSKVICIANQKGGCGKTTTSICLAQSLIIRGFKVLFIDTDSQCNSTVFYDAKIDKMATMMDILCNDEKADECIQHTKIGDIIPSDKLLKNVDIKVADDAKRFLHLRNSIKSIRDKYDFIIIDTPPQISLVLRNVLVACDYILMPVDESGWSVYGILDLVDVVNEIKHFLNQNLKVLGILIVKSRRNTKIANRVREATNEIADKIGSQCFKNNIRESVTCKEALTEFMVPLGKYSKACITNIDYENFTDEFLEEINNGKTRI